MNGMGGAVGSMQRAEGGGHAPPRPDRFPLGFSPVSRAGEQVLQVLREARAGAISVVHLLSAHAQRPGREQMTSIVNRSREYADGLTALIGAIEAQDARKRSLEG